MIFFKSYFLHESIVTRYRQNRECCPLDGTGAKLIISKLIISKMIISKLIISKLIRFKIDKVQNL